MIVGDDQPILGNDEAGTGADFLMGSLRLTFVELVEKIAERLWQILRRIVAILIIGGTWSQM